MMKKFLLPLALTLALVSLASAQERGGSPRIAYPPVLPPVLPQPVVAVEATVPDAYAAGGAKGIFTVRRTSGEDLGAVLTVHYQVRGTAVGGTQYRVLSGVLTIPADRTETRVKIKPLPDGDTAGVTTTVKLTLLPGDGYELGDPARAKVKVHAGTAP